MQLCKGTGATKTHFLLYKTIVVQSEGGLKFLLETRRL